MLLTPLLPLHYDDRESWPALLTPGFSLIIPGTILGGQVRSLGKLDLIPVASALQNIYHRNGIS